MSFFAEMFLFYLKFEIMKMNPKIKIISVNPFSLTQSKEVKDTNL